MFGLFETKPLLGGPKKRGEFQSELLHRAGGSGSPYISGMGPFMNSSIWHGAGNPCWGREGGEESLQKLLFVWE